MHPTVYIKYLLETPPKMIHDPSEVRDPGWKPLP